MANKEGFFKRVSRFFKECWLELQKTSWPTPDELRKSTLLVLAAVAVITLWIGGLDALLGLFTRRYIER